MDEKQGERKRVKAGKSVVCLKNTEKASYAIPR